MDIAGYTFGNTQGASVVKIGNTPLTVLAGGWSSTKIGVRVPVGAVTGSVIVTVAANASNSQTFTVKTFGCPIGTGAWAVREATASRFPNPSRTIPRTVS